jgi:transcriptional repressor NrdR
MLCPYCKKDNDKVIDSRSSDSGAIIRRRRQCLECGKRFTTYEKASETQKLRVVKKDSTRVPYEREKIVSGLEKACYKRPVSAEQIRSLAEKVEDDIFRQFDKEVSSTFIGQCVMNQLREFDKVAYIRFASVYKDFNDADDFVTEISEASEEIADESERSLFGMVDEPTQP